MRKLAAMFSPGSKNFILKYSKKGSASITEIRNLIKKNSFHSPCLAFVAYPSRDGPIIAGESCFKNLGSVHDSEIGCKFMHERWSTNGDITCFYVCTWHMRKIPPFNSTLCVLFQVGLFFKDSLVAVSLTRSKAALKLWRGLCLFSAWRFLSLWFHWQLVLMVGTT